MVEQRKTSIGKEERRKSSTSRDGRRPSCKKMEQKVTEKHVNLKTGTIQQMDLKTLGKLKDDKKFLEDLLANPKFTRKGYGKNIAKRPTMVSKLQQVPG